TAHDAAGPGHAGVRTNPLRGEELLETRNTELAIARAPRPAAASGWADGAARRNGTGRDAAFAWMPQDRPCGYAWRMPQRFRHVVELEDKTFLLLVVAVSAAFAAVIWPFYSAVLWGAAIAILF